MWKELRRILREAASVVVGVGWMGNGAYLLVDRSWVPGWEGAGVFAWFVVPLVFIYAGAGFIGWYGPKGLWK